MADPVNTGFDPLFGDPLRRFRAALAAQGINTDIFSGVRDSTKQQGLYENRQAELAGQPLPHPEMGYVPRAAVPGTSLHERGLAADIRPSNPADLPKMYALARQYGIQPLGASDPYHFQLGNWQQAEATQAQPMPWDQTNPANVPSRMAMNMEADGSASQPGRPVSASPIPGGSSHADFIRAYAQQIGVDPNLALGIANAEGLRAWSAKNPNAASAIDVQNGQPFSFGDFQLNVRNGLGTQALKAGIDPRDPNQWQAADRFAIDQLKAGGAGPWKGDPFAKQYLATGKVPPVPFTPSQAPGPMDPTAQAGGPGAPLGTPGSTVNPPIPTTPGTTINSNPMASLGGKIGDLATNLQKDLGKSDEQAKPDIKPLEAPPAPGARNVSPLLGNPQIYDQRMAGLNQPLTWGGGPPGQMYGAGYGPQNQPVYGTSLMSQLQMLNDPTWMNQMAGG